MNEVKSPKKPLIYYYMIVVLLVLLFNLLAMPWLAEHQIKEVDYNTFVEMVEQASSLPPPTAKPSTRPPSSPMTAWSSGSWTPASPPPARRSSRLPC